VRCQNLWQTLSPSPRVFYGIHSSSSYYHRQHEEGITIIESFLSMKQGGPLGDLLFTLARYRTFLKTVAWTPSYVFPSLVDDIHILGPLNEIIPTFDHLSTQLTLIGLRVKMLKCKLESTMDLFNHKIFSWLHFGHI